MLGRRRQQNKLIVDNVLIVIIYGAVQQAVAQWALARTNTIPESGFDPYSPSSPAGIE